MENIILKNKKLKSNWEFFQGNFLEINCKNIPKTDLVLCLDVLIHQHDYNSYKKFISKLISCTSNILLINGYLDRPTIKSNIIAYHESILETLKKYEIKQVETIGEINQISYVLIKK